MAPTKNSNLGFDLFITPSTKKLKISTPKTIANWASSNPIANEKRERPAAYSGTSILK